MCWVYARLLGLGSFGACGVLDCVCSIFNFQVALFSQLLVACVGLLCCLVSAPGLGGREQH